MSPSPKPPRLTPARLPTPGTRIGSAGIEPGWRLIIASTFALWIFCLAIGLLGRSFRYPRFTLSAREPSPIATVMHVELTDSPSPPDESASAIAGDSSAQETDLIPPPLPQLADLPSAPPMAQVAAPSPAIAFAVPVEGPVRVVDSSNARAPRQPVQASASLTATSSNTVHHLAFGVGEGRQPPPDYPRAAVLANEQGTVVVRFTVDQQGLVTSADLIQSSPWPLLNKSALRQVRDNWRFAAGQVRVYDVPIEFRLNER